MNRRKILAALAVIVGGTLAAATPASAATAILVHRRRPGRRQHRPGVELNVAFNGDFPEVVTGRRFTITPTVQYKLCNAYLKASAEPGCSPTARTSLGGMTFWVPSQAANTVEGRQVVRAVVNPTANTARDLGRCDADRQGPALHQRRRDHRLADGTTSPAPPPCPAATRSGRRRARRRWSSRSRAVGTLGVGQGRRAVAPRDRHRRRARPTPSSAASAPARRRPADRRARLRQPLLAAAPRHQPYVAGLRSPAPSPCSTRHRLQRRPATSPAPTAATAAATPCSPRPRRVRVRRAARDREVVLLHRRPRPLRRA